jgi:hypothetical protein
MAEAAPPLTLPPASPPPPAPLITGQEYSIFSNGACKANDDKTWMNCNNTGTGLTANETFQVRAGLPA